MHITTRSSPDTAIEISGFDAATATKDDIARIRDHIYTDKVVVLKGQELVPLDFIELARNFGVPVPYYEPMYHHPDSDLIFVSSNLNRSEGRIGVPKTGGFWHADYQFMPEPFAITMFYPQLLPTTTRGTRFINMATAYDRLSPRLRQAVADTFCSHSARRYVKIRPTDVYRPIGEVLDDIERATPPSRWPTVLSHPVTGEQILYLSEAFTFGIEDAHGQALPTSLIDDLLAESGQLDNMYQHRNIFVQTYEPGDVVLWDNRALIHRALHNPGNEPTESYRITLTDEHPLSSEAAA
ncbi:TauD/TfdA family dioxygenase [Mycobacterium sp. CBMA293]|uniref:(3R)-3-[(carboxymethyl)amino]fatty acid oxygenase/decarboxylase n=1 Tax=unclassified Mycolicibacterium TaxID=2636767 RepID=UPI0012DE4D37|nr:MULTISPECIES: TauD/TfdA family dioxygenase [unclassified Mycolicibacterium]MUL44665.1 TauD/TfdA family dioxygenase [Mycolicibacterium sp. CBMA 360]MUL59989.1 TauD/TfdA family dioxygenase [Mycolicibacterium sp. CBMA 335]MUL68832.1 TauD/TfdA family dioxygenase [Mycolicibacterium sp. CBMA 311]MUL93777.1 TauD/TfdA family dioxygenase [Mycolicibacterium sp. CBMA 230]MUM06020.1 taurine catabolism dioxygenase [Mycolicibacterium sp. CBMA 213]